MNLNILEINILGYKLNIFHIIIAVLLVLVISTSSTCGCMKCGYKEAFSQVAESLLPITNIKYDEFEKKTDPYKVNTLEKSKNPSDLMWSKNKFSKDCCLNNQSNYYNRNGCVCPTSEQVKHLSSRGGNHT